MDRPFVWQMIKEAIEKLNNRATYAEIKKYINEKWNDVNESTINAQILVLSVNQPSRIHYPENKRPRLTNSNSNYDILFSTGRGQVVKYNPEEHGIWEIYKNEFDGLSIRQVIDNKSEDSEEPNSFLFPIEANLRDFLIQNLQTVKEYKLKLFVDGTDRDGKEYPTGVGPIDILTTDENGNFVIFELKLSRGPDKALGQLLRYMGWVKRNLAKEKQVKGIIVANSMDEKIKYAVTMTPDVTLYEYEMKFELTKPSDI
jgi:RecB family endonuclease NucS